MAIRFYNPGSRLYEKMAFDHPVNDVKEVNLIAYYQIDAPEKSFFDVPTEMEVASDSGPIRVAVRFADKLQTDYAQYGLVRIDPSRKQTREEENVAATDKEARDKGDRLWRDYLLTKAREHIANVDRCNAAGVVPTRAKGIYAQALKTFGMEDPADKVGVAVAKQEDSEQMKSLKAELAELKALIKK